MVSQLHKPVELRGFVASWRVFTPLIMISKQRRLISFWIWQPILILWYPKQDIENPAEKLAARKELAQGLLARKLTMLERCIPEGSDWIVGPQVTIADVAIWRLLGWLTSGILDGLPADLLKNFPKIRRVCLAVDTLPKVCEWVALKYPENYNRGQY